MNNTSNVITETQINTRTELWNDHIYHISFDYPRTWPFPRNSGTGEFIPLPLKYSKLREEFFTEFDKQKEDEKKPEQAQKIILQAKKKIIEELGKILEKQNKGTETSSLGSVVSELINLISNWQTPLNSAYRAIEKFVQEWKIEESTASSTPTTPASTIRDGKDWKNISNFFTSQLVDEWIERGFDYEQVNDWFTITDVSRHAQAVKDSALIEYLVKVKRGNFASPDWWLNFSPTGEMEKVIREFNERKNIKSIPELKEIEKSFQEWKDNKTMSSARFNACFVKEDTSEYIKFVYQPPKQNFSALDNFLWYRLNIFYETIPGGWTRINHENVEVRAKRSTFMHTFPFFCNKGGQGILTYHPHIGFKKNEQVCRCPGIVASNEIIDLASDWQPSYDLYRLGKSPLSGPKSSYIVTHPYGKKEMTPVFHNLNIEKVISLPQTVEELANFDIMNALLQNTADSLSDTTYFLLPKEYDPNFLLNTTPKKINLTTVHTKKPLKELLDTYQMNRGQVNEHFLDEVNINFLWNNKVINQAKLGDLDLDFMNIEIRSNPAEIMYIFTSGKVIHRWSEDLEFTLEANKLGSMLNDISKKWLGADLSDALSGYLHDPNRKEKSSQQQRGSERKVTLSSSTTNLATAAMGSIPALLDAPHTRGDYTLAETALRLDGHNNFRVRMEFNSAKFNQFSNMKKWRNPGLRPFNVSKIATLFSKGYVKMEDVIFEGDYNGYYKSLLTTGKYFYEEDPREVFLTPAEMKDFKGEIGRSDASAVNTTIQINYKSAIGRDNLVHVDDLSWVWKDSYCRGGGVDLFPELINDPNMKKNIKRHDSAAWKFDGYAKGEGSTILQKGVEYKWYMHAFSSGEEDRKAFRGEDEGVKVILRQDGANWELAFIGKVMIIELAGNSDSSGGVEFTPENQTFVDLEDNKQTEGLDGMENTMSPEAWKTKEEVEERELNPEETREKKAQREKEEVLEQETQQTKSKHKKKDKKKEEQKQDQSEKSDETNKDKNK